MRVLILDGERNASLAAARSLASAGFLVTCASDRLFGKALFSKACNRRLIYVSPRISIRLFLEDILRELEHTHYDAILPVTESTIWPISLSRDRFEKKATVLLPPHDILQKALDKEETIRIATEIGLPVPKTWCLGEGEDPDYVAKNVTYPAVAKPARSENVLENSVVEGGRPVYANSERDLAEVLRKFQRKHVKAIVQEFIPGQGFGLFTCFHLGEPLVWFAHERLRDVHPTGSGSALRRSRKVREDLRNYAETLLRAFQWQGVGMVEFREDVRSGIPKIMEVNGRFWNSLPLAIASGVDFPRLLVESFMGGRVEFSEEYRENVVCRWLLGDVNHLGRVLMGRPKGFTSDFPDRAQTILAFLRDCINPNINYDVWSLKDPIPFFVEILEAAYRPFLKN